jgi:AIG2-like family
MKKMTIREIRAIQSDKNAALIFQYGSNTSSRRLNACERLNGDAESLGLAYTAKKYDIGFTVWSDGNNCAAADLVPGNKGNVWGVLYKIPKKLLKTKTAGERNSMESIEGSRYKIRKIEVCMPSAPRSPITVVTFIVKQNSKEENIKTNCDYVKHILAGLQEHNAPQRYIAHVRARFIENNPDLGKRNCAGLRKELAEQHSSKTLRRKIKRT